MVKFKKIPSLSAISAALMSFAALAEPTVAIDGVRQRYPWNGLIDIDYTVSGIAASGVREVDFKVEFSYASATKSIQKTCAALSSAPSVADGAHRVTWDAKADGIAAFVPDGVLTATLSLLGDPTPEEAEFMVIDISNGCTNDAPACPVTYLRATTAASESEQFNTDEYKTTKLVFRKVHAAGKTFRMGEGEYGNVTNDDPVKGKWHEVGFRQDYFLGVFEFTYGQMQMLAGGDQFGETQRSYGGNMMQPVELCPAYKLTYNQYFKSITINDGSKNGVVYEGGLLGMLNGHIGDGTASLVAFPTEAQWEYAARCDSRSNYPNGSYYDSSKQKYLYDVNLYPYAWGNSNSTAINYFNKNVVCMHPVGTREHDRWGFYDMMGNAAELVEDWYAGYDKGVGYVEGGVTWDPTGPADNAGYTSKGVRGGRFNTQDLYLAPGATRASQAVTSPSQVAGVRLKAAVQTGLTPAAAEVLSSAAVALKIDTSASAFNVFAPASANDILPISWNSDEDWADGGSAETEATVTVTKMSGDAAADPVTWTDGATVTLVKSSGEGTGVWTPMTHDLYRLKLEAGSASLFAYYNLADTADITEAKDISACTITVTGGEVEWTGSPVPPAVTVTDGGTPLVEGVDYTLTTVCVDLGPATVTVAGVNKYTGSVEKPFAIVEPVAGIVLTRVRQRYPWNGLVDIDYTVRGTQMDPGGFDLALSLETDEIAVDLHHFLQCAGCDLPTVPGTYRVTWDSAADGVKVLAKNAKFKASIAKSELTAATADFMIVDLSGGADAATYPVRYASGNDASVFNLDLYKLDRLVLRRIPAGDHWVGMSGNGYPVGDITSAKLTIPDRKMCVRLSKDFYLGIFEVTQKHYLNVVGSNPSAFVKGWNKTALPDDFRRPVEYLSHDTITLAEEGFLARLSARARRNKTAVGSYLLPTEVQWEVAARADILTEFWWGGNANYGALMAEHMWNTNNSTLDEVPGKKGTHAVGFKPANPWGFYDILGNVSEFTSDWYAAVYSLTGGDGIEHAGTAEDPVVDPLITDSTSGKYEVRGGNYSGGGDYYSHYAGYRTETATPTAQANTVGFRVSITLP